MRKNIFLKSLACLLLSGSAVTLCAQAAQKPGLYEMTSTMTWQKSPMPAGVTLPPGIPNPFAPRPMTMQICVTQAQIDRYGTAVPQNQARGKQDCTLTNIQKSSNSMTATEICTGSLQGQGTIKGSWDGNTAHTHVQFTGAMTGGRSGDSMPVEWTLDATSTFKGPDCGSVKPIAMPEAK